MANESAKIVDMPKKRDRSPAFPFISLKAAVERLAQLEAKFGRHQTPANKTALAWDLTEGSSQAQQTLAALKYFGLINSEGMGKERTVSISEDGRTYLRAQQEDVKKQILKKTAIIPKEINRFWNKWQADRPIDAVCLDELSIKNRYTDSAARAFLRVYDETMTFSGLNASDKIAEEGTPEREEPDPDTELPAEVRGGSAKTKGAKLMEGERILQDGILSTSASYRIVVSGKIGPKEIDRLIKKLELDREILADPDGEPGDSEE